MRVAAAVVASFPSAEALASAWGGPVVGRGPCPAFLWRNVRRRGREAGGDADVPRSLMALGTQKGCRGSAHVHSSCLTAVGARRRKPPASPSTRPVPRCPYAPEHMCVAPGAHTLAVPKQPPKPNAHETGVLGALPGAYRSPLQQLLKIWRQVF